jgi:hypothetical protein
MRLSFFFLKKREIVDECKLFFCVKKIKAKIKLIEVEEDVDSIQVVEVVHLVQHQGNLEEAIKEIRLNLIQLNS